MTNASRHDEDVKVLHSMGYSQELSRRMGGFQNFAISFSIICILAGGIGAYSIAFGAAGGGSIGIGWIVGAVFAMLVAAATGQIASAYPTAGGLYHWSSILGGKGWGWCSVAASWSSWASNLRTSWSASSWPAPWCSSSRSGSRSSAGDSRDLR